MDLQPQPLTLDLAKLDGLSERLVVSHHENNYTGAVKRLERDPPANWRSWTGTQLPVFIIKRPQARRAGGGQFPPWLHEFVLLRDWGGDGVAARLRPVDRDGARTSAPSIVGGPEFPRPWRKRWGGGSGWALLSWSSREGRLVNFLGRRPQRTCRPAARRSLRSTCTSTPTNLDFGAKAAAYVEAFMRKHPVGWGPLPLSARPSRADGASRMQRIRRAWRQGHS